MGVGRKPVPTEVKKRRGNPGKRSIKDAVVVEVAFPAKPEEDEWVPPPAPSQLGARGKQLWERAWRCARSYLAEIDTEVLVMACETADQRSRLLALIGAKEQRDLENAAKGVFGEKPLAWRDHVMLRSCESQLTQWLAMLAFSPTDRARLAFPEMIKNGDPIAAARKREQDRQEQYRRKFATSS